MIDGLEIPIPANARKRELVALVKKYHPMFTSAPDDVKSHVNSSNSHNLNSSSSSARSPLSYATPLSQVSVHVNEENLDDSVDVDMEMNDIAHIIAPSDDNEEEQQDEKDPDLGEESYEDQQKLKEIERQRKKNRKSLAPGIYNHAQFDESDSDSAADNGNNDEEAGIGNQPMPDLPAKGVASLTVSGLRSFLTSMDVDLPQDSKPKQYFIELVYANHPELKGQTPPPAKATKNKRR